jgi:RNA-binding protein
MEVDVGKLLGYQKKYLKGLAHSMKPVSYVGQKGLSPTLLNAIDESLTKHELIKVKFIEFKEKKQKIEIAGAIEQETASELVGMIGHVAILYRQQPDPEKRRIQVPKRQKKQNNGNGKGGRKLEISDFLERL